MTMGEPNNYCKTIFYPINFFDVTAASDQFSNKPKILILVNITKGYCIVIHFSFI
jgi:hypothetical protein